MSLVQTTLESGGAGICTEPVLYREKPLATAMATLSASADLQNESATKPTTGMYHRANSHIEYVAQGRV